MSNTMSRVRPPSALGMSTPRTVLMRWMPAMAPRRRRVAVSRSREAGVAPTARGATYTSAASTVPSHRVTLPRKLSIITPTPMTTEIAIMSAAMATALRLKDAVTPRVAIRPRGPRIQLIGATATRMLATTAAGVNSAKPRMTRNRAAKLSTRSRPENARRPAPAISRATPTAAKGSTRRRARASRWERRRTARGGAPVASMAEGREASRAPATPRAAPLRSDSGSSASSCTETAKYRSLMVWVTSPTRNLPIAIPPSSPSAVPASPTARASATMRPNISRRVTPRARKVPISGRRCTTENDIVL